LGTDIVFADHVVKPSGQAALDTKARILDAADEDFVRRGIDGARRQEIADHSTTTSDRRRISPEQSGFGSPRHSSQASCK